MYRLKTTMFLYAGDVIYVSSLSSLHKPVLMILNTGHSYLLFQIYDLSFYLCCYFKKKKKKIVRVRNRTVGYNLYSSSSLFFLFSSSFFFFIIIVVFFFFFSSSSPPPPPPPPSSSSSSNSSLSHHISVKWLESH